MNACSMQNVNELIVVVTGNEIHAVTFLHSKSIGYLPHEAQLLSVMNGKFSHEKSRHINANWI